VRYILLTEDGNKHGPADVDTLNTWIAQGRLPAAALLQEELSGKQHFASSIPQLRFPETQSLHAPPQYVAYPRSPTGFENLDGSLDLRKGWGIGIGTPILFILLWTLATRSEAVSWLGTFGLFAVPLGILQANKHLKHAAAKHNRRAKRLDLYLGIVGVIFVLVFILSILYSILAQYKS